MLFGEQTMNKLTLGPRQQGEHIRAEIKRLARQPFEEIIEIVDFDVERVEGWASVTITTGGERSRGYSKRCNYADESDPQNDQVALTIATARALRRAGVYGRNSKG